MQLEIGSPEKSFNADLGPISNVRADRRPMLASCGSMDDMDVDAMFDMPGGYNFRNVTKVFNDAARGQFAYYY